MAPKDLLANIGWEQGLIFNIAVNTGNVGGVSGGSIVSNQYGRPGLQFKADYAASAAAYAAGVGSGALGGSATRTLVARVYRAFAGLPTGGDHRPLIQVSSANLFTGNGATVRLRDDGKLEAGFLDAIDEVQTVTVNATGGTYTLTFTGQTTAAIAWNANAAAVQAALEALSNIDPGDVTVTGGPGGSAALVVTFKGQYHGVNVAAMTASSASLTGGSHIASISTTTTGSAPNGHFFNGPLDPAGVVVSSFTIPTATWIRVDVYCDTSTTTWRLKWQVEILGDGVGPRVMTDATRAGQAATDFVALGMHREAGDAPLNNAPIEYSDDLAIASDSAQYPIGPGKTVVSLPAGFGTNVGTAQFTDESGGAITGTSWNRIADGPPLVNGGSPASAGDGLSLRVVAPFTVTNLLEFTFQALTSDQVPPTADVSCVVPFVEIYCGPTYPAINSNLDFWQGGSLLRAALTLTSNTTVVAGPWGSLTQQLRAVTAPAGGWTLTKFNSLSAKWFTATGGTAGRYYGLSSLLLEVHITAGTEADLEPAPPPPPPPASGLTRLGFLPFPDIDLQVAFDHDSGAYQAAYSTLARSLIPIQYLRGNDVSGGLVDSGRRSWDAFVTGGLLYGQSSPLADPDAASIGFGGAGNEIQHFTIPHLTSGGTYTLTYSGQTTAPIAYSAGAATIQGALEGLSNIAPGDVNVTGSGGSYFVEFTGTLADTDVSQMTSDGSLLTPTATDPVVTTIAQGVAGGAYAFVELTGLDEDPPAAAVTIIAWVKTNGAPADLTRIFEMGDGSPGSSWAIVFNGGWVGLDSYNSGDLYGAAAPSADAFHLIAFVIHPENVVDMQAVIDGVEIELEQRLGTPTFTNITFADQHIAWGADAAGANVLDGSMAEMMIVPYAVPIERLKALWNARLEGAVPATDPETFNWTSLRSRLYEGSFQRGRNTELDRIESSQLSAVLENNDRALEPEYDVRGFAPDVLPARPTRIRVGRIHNYVRNPRLALDEGFWDLAGAGATRVAVGNRHWIKWTTLISGAAFPTEESWAPVIPGQPVYVHANVVRDAVSGTGGTPQLHVKWYDRSGSLLGEDNLAQPTGPGSPVAGQEYELRATATAPADAAYVAVGVSFSGTAGTTATIRATDFVCCPLSPGERAPAGVAAGRSPFGSSSANYVGNPRASRDLEGWEADSSSGTPTLIRQIDDDLGGPFGVFYDDWEHSFEVEATLTGTGQVILQPTDPIHQAAAVETGDGVYLDVYVRQLDGCDSITVKARLMQDDGTIEDQIDLQTITSYLDEWQRIGGNVTVPAGTTRVGLEVWFNGPTGHVQGRATGVMIQQSGTPDPDEYNDTSLDDYRDGDGAAFIWEGARHASRTIANFGVAAPGNLYYGYVQGWDLTYPSYRRGEIQLRAVDALGAFMQDQIFSAHPQQLTGSRVHDLLDAIGWPLDQRQVAPGTLEVVAVDYSASPTDAASALQATASSEGGLLYLSVDGVVVFEDVNTRGDATLAASFGDNDEVPYLTLMEDYSLDQIRNEIVAQLADGTTVTAADYPSQRQYRRRHFDLATLLTAGDAQTRVDALLAAYKDPAIRFTAMTLEPRRDPYKIFPVVTAINLSKWIHLSRLPAGGGDPLERDCFTESVAHRFSMRTDEVTWSVSYTMSVKPA